MLDKLLLHVRNYRAIKAADIELADLTVLAGVNASGKSTLARMFHRLVCIESNYTFYATNEVRRCYIEAVGKPLQKIFAANVRNSDERRMLEGVTTPKWNPSQKFSDFLGKLRGSLIELLASQRFIDVVSDPRFVETLNAYIPDVYKDMPRMKGKDGRSQWPVDVCRYFEQRYTPLINQGAASSFLFFAAEVDGDRLDDVGKTWYDGTLFENTLFTPLKTELSFSDGKIPIVDFQNLALPMGRIFSLQQSFYIARPSVDFPSVTSRKLRLNGIDYPISAKTEKKEGMAARNLGLDALIGGRIAAPKGKNHVATTDWQYSDGLNVYGLGQCADGIKSLATLSILDTYQFLERGTLLIIDEPEVHLHPQWVVEMARILVVLAKERGVKVLVTTHSPDLIHAIRDFAENEEFADRTCFYLSRRGDEEEGGYSYKGLGMDIGPIFTVFNVAKEQIYNISQAIRERRAQ